MLNALKRVSLALALSSTAFSTQAAELATPLSKVKYAENMAKANGKVYVTTDGAVHVLSGQGNQWQHQPVPATYRNGQSVADCTFGGITTVRSHVYAVCTDKAAAVHLFVLDSLAQQPAFSEVTLPENTLITGVKIANGLSSNGNDQLYLADHGAPLLPGKIVRLTLSGSHNLASQATLHRFTGCKPNGVKFHNGKLYVTLNPFSYVGLSQLYRYDISNDGLKNGKPLYSAWSFLDDFTLVNDGFLIADYMGGRVVHIKEDGSQSGTALTEPVLPSSVTLSDEGHILVTWRQSSLIATGETGSVHVYDSPWGALTLR